jgi:hypothetical protein
MGPFVIAWLAGEGIVIYRSVKTQKAPPGPGQLLFTSGLFVLLAMMAEFEKARFLATALAWGYDIAAFMDLTLNPPATLAASNWPPDLAPNTVIIPTGDPSAQNQPMFLTIADALRTGASATTGGVGSAIGKAASTGATGRAGGLSTPSGAGGSIGRSLGGGGNQPSNDIAFGASGLHLPVIAAPPKVYNPGPPNYPTYQTHIKSGSGCQWWNIGCKIANWLA